MTQDFSNQDNSTPAQKAMKQTAKMRPVVENEDADPVGAGDAQAAERSQRDAGKPVGESSNHGSSPYEQPNHISKSQRDR